MTASIHVPGASPEPELTYTVITGIAIMLVCIIAFHKSKPLENSSRIPYTLPFLKSTVPFVFDGFNFLQASM